MCALDAGPRRVPQPEPLGPLLTAGRLQRLVLLAGQKPDDPRLLLRPRALRPQRTRRAIRRTNRASKTTPFFGYVFGSQERLSFPAGQVTT